MTGPQFLNGDTQSGPCCVTVSNLGPDPASNVVVRFTIDPDLLFPVGRISAGSYDPFTQVWTIGSMLPNSQETLECFVGF
jgi:hypothetical protein